ncbi:MAG: hypothetical protein ABWJ42_06310 [Sulfolobales archaeon]
MLLSGRLYRITYDNMTYFIYRTDRESYLIIPRVMCTCRDFIINVVFRKKKTSCIHLKAVELAMRKNRFFEQLHARDPVNVLYKVVSTGSLR